MYRLLAGCRVLRVRFHIHLPFLLVDWSYKERQRVSERELKHDIEGKNTYTFFIFGLILQNSSEFRIS